MFGMFEWRKLIWQFLAGTGTKHRRINATSAKTSQKFTARGHGNGESLVMRLISSSGSKVVAPVCRGGRPR